MCRRSGGDALRSPGEGQLLLLADGEANSRRIDAVFLGTVRGVVAGDAGEERGGDRSCDAEPDVEGRPAPA